MASVITLNKHSYSIRRRLTLLLLGSVGALVLIANLALSIIVSTRLQAEYDVSLLAKARALVTLTEQDLEGVELDFADEFMPEFNAPESPEYFQLWLQDDTLERSNSLGYGEDDTPLENFEALAYHDLPRFSTSSGEPRFRDLMLPDGRSGRLVQIDFLPQIDEDEQELHGEFQRHPATLVVAREREQLNVLLHSLHGVLFAISAFLIALIVLVVRFAVRSSLKPLKDIREQVEQLDADSLDSRLQPRRPTLELDAVITQFNALLNRLEAAFRRERQFSSDVAHELRTPLAELRNLSEVALRWPEDSAMVEDFLKEILGATLQMERIVINLLALARCEKGLEIVEKTEVDVASLVDAAWSRVLPEAQEKQLVFQREGAPTLKVCTSRDQLELILNNLFSNAVTYSPAGGAVSCSVTKNGNTLQLSVANRAEHLESDDLPLVFDRLWRKDPARAGGHHAGLGLTLVKAYAESLKLAIQVALEPDQIFRITLSGAVR